MMLAVGLVGALLGVASLLLASRAITDPFQVDLEGVGPFILFFALIAGLALVLMIRTLLRSSRRGSRHLLLAMLAVHLPAAPLLASAFACSRLVGQLGTDLEEAWMAPPIILGHSTIVFWALALSVLLSTWLVLVPTDRSSIRNLEAKGPGPLGDGHEQMPPRERRNVPTTSRRSQDPRAVGGEPETKLGPALPLLSSVWVGPPRAVLGTAVALVPLALAAWAAEPTSWAIFAPIGIAAGFLVWSAGTRDPADLRLTGAAIAFAFTVLLTDLAIDASYLRSALGEFARPAADARLPLLMLPEELPSRPTALGGLARTAAWVPALVFAGRALLTGEMVTKVRPLVGTFLSCIALVAIWLGAMTSMKSSARELVEKVTWAAAPEMQDPPKAHAVPLSSRLLYRPVSS